MQAFKWLKAGEFSIMICKKTGNVWISREDEDQSNQKHYHKQKLRSERKHFGW